MIVLSMLSMLACGPKETHTQQPVVVPKQEEEAVSETTGPTETKGFCL